MYVCICICTYIYVYIYIHKYTHTYLYLYMYIYFDLGSLCFSESQCGIVRLRKRQRSYTHTRVCSFAKETQRLCKRDPTKNKPFAKEQTLCVCRPLAKNPLIVWVSFAKEPFVCRALAKRIDLGWFLQLSPFNV